MYESKSARDNGIESVKKDAPDAKVDDQTWLDFELSDLHRFRYEGEAADFSGIIFHEDDDGDDSNTEILIHQTTL